MSKRILAAALAAIGLLAADAASAQALKKVTFLANYAFHGRHSPFFLGVDKGFYKEAGFDVTILPTTGSGFVVTAIDGGKADFGMAESTSVVQAIAKGAKVKAFNVFMDVTTSGFASMKPYPTLESLKGKTIAASLTDSSRVILPILFDQKGIDPNSVKWEAADPSVYYSLMFSGKIDMFSASIDGDIPTLTKLLAPQGKQVYFTGFPAWGYDVFGYFLIASAERIARDPKEVKAFSDTTVKAVKYAMAHPEEDAKVMVKYNPTLNEDTVLAQWKQSIKAMDTDYVRKHGYGIAEEARVQRTIDLVRKAMKLEVNLKPADVYVPGFVTK
jgi:NitT/TauT family transport system substrate-binding protein